MGFVLTGLGLLVLAIILVGYNNFHPNTTEPEFKALYESIAGFGLGGSSIALFGRVGGGIYTKAADVGADLVGKVEKELPEDSPKNPGTIADNVHINSELVFMLFSGEIGTRIDINGRKFWIDYNYTNYREHINQKVAQYAPYDTLRFNGDLAFDYFRGHGASIKYKYEKIKPAFLKNMFPGNGFVVNAKLGYEWNNFMNGFGVNEEYSTFGANFSPHNTYRFTFGGTHHFTLDQSKRWVSSLGTQFGWLSNNEVDNFFHFFSGGLPGLKGYTFYNEDLTGSRQIIVTSETRIPIFLEKNYAVAHLNIQNMSLGMVAQTGGSFNNQLSEFIEENNYKFSAGLELRIHGFSFYAYPTALEYEYHQAVNDNEESGKHYLSLLFGF